MSVSQIRWSNLNLLIAKFGSIANINEKLERTRNNSLLYQLKNKSINSTSGKKRNIGNKIAREIEAKLGLDDGWMDIEHADPPETTEEKPKIKFFAGGDGIREDGKDSYDMYSVFMEPLGNYKNENDIVGFVIQNATIKDIAPMGSVILVDTSVHTFNGDGIYLFKISDQLVWRQVSFSLDGVFSIKKDATDSQVYQSLENFTIAGKAFYVWKGSPL